MTRNVTTVLRIDGEKEYNNAIKNCNAELKLLDSQLKAVSVEYAENANSLEALQAKSEIYASKQSEMATRLDTISEALQKAQLAESEYAARIAETQQALDTAKENLEKYGKSYTDANGNVIDAEKAVSELNAKLEANAEKHAEAENAVRKWETKLNDAKAASAELDREIDKNAQYMDEAKTSTDGTASSIDKFGKVTESAEEPTKGFTDAAMQLLAIAGVAKVLTDTSQAAIELAANMADAQSIVMRATGATGEALEELDAVTKAVYATVDTEEISNVADIVGELNTRLEIEGETLEKCTFLINEYADATDSNAKTAAVNITKVMQNWGVGIEELETLLNKLTVAGQKSGISQDTLTGYIIENKAQFKQLGYSLDETIALLSGFEKSGINTSQTLMGFRQAVTNLSKDGGDLRESLDATIDTIKSMASETEAVNYAVTVFGTRAGQELAYAIRDGRFELGEWIVAIQDSDGAMLKTADAADTFRDKLQQSSNHLRVAIDTKLSPTVERLAEAGAVVIDGAADLIEKNPELLGLFTALAAALTTVVVALTGFAVVQKITPMIVAFNVALASNPYGAAALAISACIAALVGFSAAANSASSSAGGFSDATNKIASSAKANSESYNSEIAEIEATGNAAHKLADELDVLMSAESRSITEKERIVSVIGEINQLYPDMLLNYDSETDRINQSTTAIRKNIETKIETATLEATLPRLAQNRIDLELVQQQKAKEQAYYDSEVARWNAQYGGFDWGAHNYNPIDFGEYLLEKTVQSEYPSYQAISNLSGEEVRLKNEYAYLIELTDKLKTSTGNYTESIVEAGDETAKTADNVDYAARIYGHAAQEFKTTADEFKKQVDDAGDVIVSALKEKYSLAFEAQKEYNAAALSAAKENANAIYDERIGKLQSEIDVIDALTKRENDDAAAAKEEKQLSEILAKRDSANLQIEKLKTEQVGARDGKKKALEAQITELQEEAADAQREYDEIIEEKERKAVIEAREAQKAALNAEIKELEEARSAEISAIEEEYQKLDKAAQSRYNNAVSEEKLLAEARKMVLESSQSDMVQLLENYAPKYQAAGQKLSDALISGLGGVATPDAVTDLINIIAQTRGAIGAATMPTYYDLSMPAISSPNGGITGPNITQINYITTNNATPSEIEAATRRASEEIALGGHYTR